MYKRISVAVLALSTTVVFAEPIAFKGQKEIIVDVNTSNAANNNIRVTVPLVDLTAAQKEYLHKRARQNSSSPSVGQGDLPEAVNLGMHGTPVLNQGRHGSCVTFAVTGAFDAALGAGDYVSQLCNLELGSYLFNHGKIAESGWDGSWGSWVLDQIGKYGIISRNYQNLEGCAGVYEYPTNSTSRGRPMQEKVFLKHSIPITNLVGWNEILRNSDALTANSDIEQVFASVKEELAKGNRVTFGTLLDISQGHAGAVGTHNTRFDTWVLTPSIIENVEENRVDAGHEMIIIGYDDNAYAEDTDGNITKGLFTLRNSWSDSAGDKGNYYLSYDYFKLMTLEAAAIQVKKK